MQVHEEAAAGWIEEEMFFRVIPSSIVISSLCWMNAHSPGTEPRTVQCLTCTTHPGPGKQAHSLLSPRVSLICVVSSHMPACLLVFITASRYHAFLFFLGQGCIPLHGSQVNELPANQDELGRHFFEIVPGGLACWQLCCAGEVSEKAGHVQVIKRQLFNSEHF